MGFWNETCLLSRLPIESDTPCAAFFIAQRERPLGDTYCDDFYAPISHIFFGEYNGYGRLQNIQDKNNVWQDLYLNPNPVDFEILDHEPAMPNVPGRDITDLESLTDTVKSHRVYIKKYIGERFEKQIRLPVYLILIRKAMFDAAMDAAKQKIANDMLLNRRKLTQLRLFDKSEATRELSTLMSFMDTMRIGLMPTIGAGSQYALDDKCYAYFYRDMLNEARDIAHKNI